MIPYGRQCIDQTDIDAVVAVLRSDWLTTGPALRQFESDLASRCSASHAVACNSGTAALHLAYSAAGIGPGATVVVPANTFLATANAAIYLGADVRFCDVDPRTGLMTPETLAAVLDPSVSAVVPVHFAGQSCEMAAIVDLLRMRCPDACLIEDASHAIGGSYADGSPVGAPQFGSMVTFSFHPVKHVAAGEGGAVTTNCQHLREALERFRCHGMIKEPSALQNAEEGPWYYEMHNPGFNYRIPEASCALAASQLQRLNQFILQRQQVAERYLEELSGVEHLTLPPSEHLATSAWHLFCLHINFEAAAISRTDLVNQLRRDGVGTQVHYFPVALQPYYRERYQLDESQFPGAVRHYEQALSIPMFSSISDEEVGHVIQSVRRVLRAKPLRGSVAA